MTAAASSAALPDFSLPSFQHESSSGWGPSSSSLPLHLLGLPFMPFNKNDKLSRISDWLFPRDSAGPRPARAEDDDIAGVHAATNENHPNSSSSLLSSSSSSSTSAADEGGAFSLVDHKSKVRGAYGDKRGGSQKPRGGRAPQQQSNAGGFSASLSARASPSTNAAPKILSAASSSNTVGSSWSNAALGSSSANKKVAVSSLTAAQQRSGTGAPQGRASAQPQQGNFRGNRRFGFEQKERAPSVAIREDFVLKLDVELSELSGVTFEPIGKSQELLIAGELKPYNASLSRVTPRSAITLQRYDKRTFFAASTTEDPLLCRLIAEQAGQVFATDSILSLLMSASRSLFSWDVLLHKKDGQLIFDKRADSKIDYLSVNENAVEHSNNVFNNQQQQEEELDATHINHPSSLSLEATQINHNFSQQALVATGPSRECPLPNPFLSSLAVGGEPASLAYRYNRFKLGQDLSVVVRGTVNAYAPKAASKKIEEEEEEVEEEEKNDVSYVQTHVLNEYDPRLAGNVDWKQKLESQTGAILAIEMKKNSFKLARFLSSALLGDVDEVKLGFVTRFNSKSVHKHQVLMAKHYSTQTLAESVNIRTKTLWGSLKVLLDKLLALEDGEYLLLRDANKPMLHVYSIPEDAFDTPATTANANAEVEA